MSALESNATNIAPPSPERARLNPNVVKDIETEAPDCAEIAPPRAASQFQNSENDIAARPRRSQPGLTEQPGVALPSALQQRAPPRSEGLAANKAWHDAAFLN